MAGLSSIISRRWVTRSDSSAMGALRRGERQREREGCPCARTCALGAQRSTQFLGRQRTAVQPEAMTVFARGEAMTEDTVEILRRDTDAGVADGDDDLVCVEPYADRHALLGAAGFVTRILGVADDVYQDLQDLVLVDGYRRHLLEVAHQRDAMATEGAGVHPQAILDQSTNIDDVSQTAAARVTLLHRHDLFDVLDIAAQLRQL